MYVFVLNDGKQRASIRLIDALGRIVMERENDMQAELIELYIGDINPGLYFIQWCDTYQQRIGIIVKR